MEPWQISLMVLASLVGIGTLAYRFHQGTMAQIRAAGHEIASEVKVLAAALASTREELRELAASLRHSIGDVEEVRRRVTTVENKVDKVCDDVNKALGGFRVELATCWANAGKERG